jgi:hypothetical protein
VNRPFVAILLELLQRARHRPLRCIKQTLLPVVPVLVDVIVLSFFMSRWALAHSSYLATASALLRTYVVRYSYHVSLSAVCIIYGAHWLLDKIAGVFNRALVEAQEAQGVITLQLQNRT